MAAAGSIDNPRHVIAHELGLGRGMVRAAKIGIVISSTFGALGMGWAWLEAVKSRDRAQVFVVYLDNKNSIVGISGLDSKWQPEDGLYLERAWWWVYYLRSRPRDEPTLNVQRNKVRRETDAILMRSLEASISEADETVNKKAAIEVRDLTVNMFTRSNDRRSAVIVAKWTEQVMTGSEQPVKWTATLRMVYQPVRNMESFTTNQLGIYVVEFQPSKADA